jgi:high-affinity nickel-transport protein
MAAVGAAFALSFDTVSQTALFALTASNLAGALFSVGLGMLFMIGMMCTDGLNGLWVARLLRATSRRALVASRVMGLAIAFLSLSIAALGIAKYFAPALAAILDDAGLLIGKGAKKWNVSPSHKRNRKRRRACLRSPTRSGC